MKKIRVGALFPVRLTFHVEVPDDVEDAELEALNLAPQAIDEIDIIEALKNADLETWDAEFYLS